MDIETIKIENQVLAIIVKTSGIRGGRNYISPKEFPLQVGISTRKKDTFLEPHEHPCFEKLENLAAQEIVYVQKGKIKVGIYKEKEKFTERILSQGDLVIFNSGHDLEFLQDSQFILIKQGPYREDGKQYLNKNDPSM